MSNETSADEQQEYASFLIRMWRSTDEAPAEWRGVIEHLQSSRCLRFSSLGELSRLLDHLAEASRDRVHV